MIHNMTNGLTTLLAGGPIGYLLAGTLLGVVVGVVPGLSTAVVLSVLLSFIYHIDLTGALCLFLGSQAGSFYSASITSILLNTPAHPEAFAITLDGYPMARKGQAGRALGLSAASTCFGGLVGCGVLLAFIPLLNDLPGLFHPPEYVGLVVLAMLLVGTLGTDSVGKAIAAGGAGLLVSVIGPAPIGGQARFTFGSIELESGVALAAVALGVFAVTQMAMVFGTGTTVASQDMTGKAVAAGQAARISANSTQEIIAGGLETLRHWIYVIQGGITGAITGIVPGIGAFAANFMSYGVAQQLSRNKKAFGTGAPEGIVAPESASLAKEAGSMIPILGLGIPGGVGGALFLAALTIKGVRTGYGFTGTYPILPYQIVWVIALSGIIGTVMGVVVGPGLMKVMAVPGPILVPFILTLSVVGAFLVDTEMASVYEVVVFGLIGLGMRRMRYPLSAFLIGLVLGPLLETNVYLTKNAFPGVSFLWERPLADVLAALAILVLVLKTRATRRERRAVAAGKDVVLDTSEPIAVLNARTTLESRGTSAEAAYPLLALVMTTFLLASAGFAIGYAVTHYQFDAAAMPVIAGTLVAVPCLLMLPRDILGYRAYRKKKAAMRRPALDLAEAKTVIPGLDEAASTAPAMVPAEHSTAAPIAIEATVRLDVAASVGSAAGAGAGQAPASDGVLSHAGAVLEDGGRAEPASVLDPEGPVRVPDSGEQPPAQAGAPSGRFPPIREKAWGRNGQYSREALVFVWLALLVFLCWAFGFAFGVPAFVVAYSILSLKRHIYSIWFRALFGALAAAAMWLISNEALGALHILIEPRFHL